MVRAGRLSGFDGLRGIAALSVLTFHTWLYGAPGEPLGVDVGHLRLLFSSLDLGVVLFFTLSGFLLYRGFAAVILGLSTRVDVRSYALGRFLRIAPAYWVALIGVGVVLSAALVRAPGGDFKLGDLRGDPGVLVANVTLTQNYLPATAITGIGPAWTLVVEIAFYILLPLLALPAIALAARGGSSVRRRLLVALAPAVALLLLGVAMAEATRAFPSIARPDWSANWQTVLMRSFLLHADLRRAVVVLEDLFQVARSIAAARIDAIVALGIGARIVV